LNSCKDDDNPSPTADLEALPADTGGTHTPHKLNSDASPYAYYMYTPSGYTNDGPKYPLLIFLHGSGEQGNSSTNAAMLDKVLVNGPPKLIKSKTWKPKYPMLVASLQCHDGWWDVTKTKKVTEFLMANYAVDTTRIYMTGLSMGGYGVWDQIAVVGVGAHITAAVPISGSGNLVPGRAQRASAIPIWSFHGVDDKTVLPDFDIAMTKAINDLSPKIRAKLTIYPGTGHDAWSKTYDGTGKGTGAATYDQFDMDIYEWMFQYKKGK